jgi:2-haloacid dehalogenase
VIDFSKYKVLTFDCYGTLIDWEKGIETLVAPWLSELGGVVPSGLLVTSFAIMQAKHQQVRPVLLYPEVLRRAWTDIEGTFGWDENAEHAGAFANSAGEWPPFPDTIESLRYLARFYKLAILSNVDNASLARTLRLLEVPFELTVTAEDVCSYKPGLAHFERAIQEFAKQGIKQSEILHVAQSKHHDVAPGRQLGLTTVWVNRRYNRKGSGATLGGATLATEAEPNLSVTSLAELAALHKARNQPAAAS